MNPEGEQAPQPLPQQPTSPQPIQPQPPQETTSNPQAASAVSSLRQIRTYQGDIADAIDKQNESVVSIQRAEEAKRDAMRTLGPKAPEENSGSTKALIYTVLSFILVGAGIAGAWYSYSTFKEKTAPPVLSTPPNQLVGASKVTNIDASTLSRQSLLAVFTSEREKERKKSVIEQLELRRGAGADAELITTSDFFVRLNTHAPDVLVRAFDPVFMLGLYDETPSHPFILIALDSFENAFPGMLAWEPRLAEDMLPLFAAQSADESTSTASAFTDISIANRDARVLKDQSGKTVLLYAFFDNELLILTDNEDTFRLLINRLQAEKLSR